ncbi:hypothetical protein PACTADRAFT_36052 [Pachysolen tannophilus NRRL Y-2460]|uniref:Prenyltransferase alpha-alpha toroid domain-containing protein n=1 Tax=Pachysolen tannophilus NRRL Y-2460 TaxID=669874 RepID=A0A1E4TNV3_PACTA|nr:hypothetical protein PACTADRAFT_36052 [Pachysolen tannophilus NRRL Y-2460]
MTMSAMPELLLEKHVRYFHRLLGILPSQFQSADSNKLVIIYFALNGLDILNKLDTVKIPERELLIKRIYENYLVLPGGEGFRGSETYNLGENKSSSSYNYDPPNLAATFIALSILFILKDSSIVQRLDRDKIMKYVQRCQIQDGSFKPILNLDGKPFGDSDLRYSMIAATIRKFLKYDKGDNNDIDLKLLEASIISRKSYDGGFGSEVFTESHGGLTYCGISTLKLINRIEGKSWDKTIDFLIHRQISFTEYNKKELEYEFNDIDDIGGFNGRLNKYGDTCYAFWCLGSLKILSDEFVKFVDFTELEKYLLNKTQNKIMGGFNKTSDEDEIPDPFHSFMGIITLSIINDEKSRNDG